MREDRADTDDVLLVHDYLLVMRGPSARSRR